MRILAVGDIHMSIDHFQRIPGIRQADLVILNGDLTNYGNTRDAKEVLEAILAINPHVLAQFGNLDKPEIDSYLEELGINLHNQARIVKQHVCFIGVGGANQTPFNTPSEFSESQIETFVQNGYEQAKTYIGLTEPIAKIKIPLILVTHAPPARTRVDRLHNGRHVGSTAIRRFIEAKQPALCISGHIHEAVGMDGIGRTPIYNPGMLQRGGRLEIVIQKSRVHTTFYDGT